MNKPVAGFFMAWGMFWVVPCPAKLWNEKARGWMLLFLPVIGILIGGVWAALAWVLGLVRLPGMIDAALLAVCPFLLTGFIHLDGYMDCCDAILSRRDLAERQRILKDSHTGAFAVISLGILLLLAFSIFTGLLEKTALWELVFIPAAARSVSALCVLAFSPMPGSSYEKIVPGLNKGYRWASGIMAVLLAVLPFLIFGRSGICALAAQAGALLAVLFGRGQLGGMNGDISGYGITVGELVGLAALALL